MTDMSENENGARKSARDYKVRKSRVMGMINWTHVISTYFPQFMVAGVGILVLQIMHQTVIILTSRISSTDNATLWTIENISAVLVELRTLFGSLFHSLINTEGTQHDLLSTGVKTTFLILVAMAWIVRMDNPVYLLAFSTFKAPLEWRLTHDEIMRMLKLQNCFTEESLNFMRRLLERSGTGQATAWPPGIIQSLNGKPVDRSIEGSRHEAETVIFDVVDKALKKANVDPKEIDILVINCSLFSPTPSLCALVISKFGMRSDINSFNLSGMGCGASLISVDLAKNLLQRRSFGGKALVVSTEIITPNLYHGNERGFLVQNVLFRCGGAAMVLSNKWIDGQKAWYKLLHLVRVQGTGDDAYNCVYETEDDVGNRGVTLSRDIVKVAGKTMEKNLTILGPYILPLSEQAQVVWSVVTRFVIKQLRELFKKIDKEKWSLKLPLITAYVPDFKRGIDHFCIHAGGRAVIDGIEKNMKLAMYHTEPSRMTLLNYGNTSSSSIWYELEYIQETQKSNPLRKGDRVLQVAFGSGFKCTSGVWLKL